MDSDDEEYEGLEEDLEELVADIFNMTFERDSYNEEYARMNEEQAGINYERVQEEISNLDSQIQERRAEAEWQQKMFNQFEEMMNDPALDYYEEEDAMWERDWAAELLEEVNDFISEQESRKQDLQAELNGWKATRDEAATFLAEAEENRARQALVTQELAELVGAAEAQK